MKTAARLISTLILLSTLVAHSEEVDKSTYSLSEGAAGLEMYSNFLEEEDPAKMFDIGHKLLLNGFGRKIGNEVRLKMYLNCASGIAMDLKKEAPVKGEWKKRIETMPLPDEKDSGLTIGTYAFVKTAVLHLEILALAKEKKGLDTDFSQFVVLLNDNLTYLEIASSKKGEQQLPKNLANSARDTIAKDKNLIKAAIAIQNERAKKREALNSGDAAEPENKVAPDVQRFMEQFKGKTRSFKVQHDDGGGFASRNDLVLEDAASHKKFSIGYTYGFAKSLGVKVGDNISVRFSETGEPKSIKNEANGVSHGVENWKASGFGW